MQYEVITINDKELKELKNLSEFTIENIEITSNEEYINLAELLKKVKGKIKEIKEFFKEPKKQAYDNHKSISRLEQEMLDKVLNFESKAKESISNYQLKLEKQNTIENPVDMPKVKGVSSSNKYEWEVIDKNKIPLALGNLWLWTLDDKVISSLVKSTDGTIEIPGIKITKKKSISVRGE